MANRAALILADGSPDGARPGDGSLAYGTRNDVAPFWFAALEEADLEGWEARWQALTVEEPAEADVAAAVLWIPWHRAEARLQAAAARVAAAAPPWAGHFAAWQAALIGLARRRKAGWLGLDLVEIFAFHEEPREMLREARAGIAVFEGRAPMAFDRQDDPIHLGGHPDEPTLPRPPVRGRVGWREWSALPGLVLIGIGAWTMTGSVLVTIGAGLVLVLGFAMMLRQAADR